GQVVPDLTPAFGPRDRNAGVRLKPDPEPPASQLRASVCITCASIASAAGAPADARLRTSTTCCTGNGGSPCRSPSSSNASGTLQRENRATASPLSTAASIPAGLVL